MSAKNILDKFSYYHTLKPSGDIVLDAVKNCAETALNENVQCMVFLYDEKSGLSNALNAMDDVHMYQSIHALIKQIADFNDTKPKDIYERLAKIRG